MTSFRPLPGYVPCSVRRLPSMERKRIMRVVHELHFTHGLTCPAISVVLDLYEGVSVSVTAVRTWIFEMNRQAGIDARLSERQAA